MHEPRVKSVKGYKHTKVAYVHMYKTGARGNSCLKVGVQRGLLWGRSTSSTEGNMCKVECIDKSR